MDKLDQIVAAHYDVKGLLDIILTAVGAGSQAQIDREILSPVDEFHLGGAQATDRLVPHLALTPDRHLLDIGSGVGGPARHVAGTTGARVTGLDLTPGYVDLATALSARTGLAGNTAFTVGSALDIPFGDASFDAAMMLHVGMNIPDKARLMAEAARVLRPGAIFVVYDIMRTGDGDPAYPMPWAATPDFSFLEPVTGYIGAAQPAGFAVVAEIPRAEEAKAFLRQTRERVEARKAEGLPPPPGVNLVMGADAPAKLANLGAAVMQGTLSPIELVLRRN